MSATLDARRALEEFDGGAHSLPVDPVSIARSLGINVFTAALDNTLSGFIAKLADGGDTNIFLNSEHAAVRQRFTCAHELGHYFAIQKAQEPKATYFHRRDSLSACGTNSEEIYANQFAAELLMPEARVRELHRLGLDAYGLAKKFHVSFDAVNHRLKNLRLV
ncbi:ImmA/IrrE family metallo-endopeptidase [Rathayibacter sp. AY1E2]|uniref:ImmA/IrrE family metallo-endopeptidase n=1 Tax=Rathayibacter sp. AY1E2 TaxID=2080550 RepID=UPI000CE7EA25|nr:ImmA/IrrE family metallo-endopeptidase [Rathayibacter sp. AY1E2]PPH50207.1 hypothetical protein C5C49_15335 [Rathayibacter sp. AY1E2]